MLDINYILENQKAVRKAIKDKGVALSLDDLLKTLEKRNKLLHAIEALQAERNEHAKRIRASGAKKPSAEHVAQGKSLKVKLASLEPKLRIVEQSYGSMMLLVPNIPADTSPIGKDDTANQEVRSWGKPRKKSETPFDHSTLGKNLNLLDLERGVKVAGFRGYFLKNGLVRLQMALMQYCLDSMQKNGFEIMISPTMMREMALIGSGHFPEAQEEVFKIDDNYLAGTSEPALLAYRAEEILALDELPLKYAAISPCYRREVGSYGKDTKGLYRVHEFWKVEQVIISSNDMAQSMKLFEEMLIISERILQSLDLPYRVVAVSTGDMGSGKYAMYDLETWMPSRNAFGETHSCSHLTDWQSRRLHMRYKDKHGKIVYPYTMNNTVIASPRILIALMENHQQADGSILIPKVLQPYCGNLKKLS